MRGLVLLALVGTVIGVGMWSGARLERRRSGWAAGRARPLRATATLDRADAVEVEAEAPERAGGPAVPPGSPPPPAVGSARAATPGAAAAADPGAAVPAVATGDAAASRLRGVVDQLDSGVVVWGDDGSELYRNAAARRLAEARDGTVLVAAAIEEVLRAALAGRRVRRNVDLFGPPAQSFVVTAFPADGGGAVAMVEDRSLARRTETVRRDFVANISHELKTPIGALGLLAETIRDEPDVTVVARLAERMTDEADRVSRTVDDLLELSRIEFADDAESCAVAVDVPVAEAMSRIDSAADQAEIAIRSEVPADLVVEGDRRQLVSALFNLLDNAVKYSPQGSEVVVAAERDGDRVRLSVTDHGIGVPRRDLDRIFERFYRVDRARSRETGGTGLGLAIVRHVASNHRGEVLVSSVEGVGSTFTLVLPAAVDADGFDVDDGAGARSGAPEGARTSAGAGNSAGVRNGVGPARSAASTAPREVPAP